jgi:transposase InsO family protein
VDSYAWKKYKATTDSNRQLPVHENKLNRSFEVTTPNTAWAADLTYIWTAEGWLYLAVVIDLFSRKGIGWYDVRDYGEKACSRCPHHGSGAKKSMRRNPSPFGSWHPVCKQGLIRRYSIKPASLAA